MIARLLPPEEWDRLEGTELGELRELLTPDVARVLVVEEDGQIIGTWMLLTIRHVEGLWIHPDHRGRGGVVRALLREMQQWTAEFPAVITASRDPAIDAYLERLGAHHLDARWFLWPTKES